jgi:hypothetical protein
MENPGLSHVALKLDTSSNWFKGLTICVKKVCVGCGIEKPLELFRDQKRGLLGKNSRCTACVQVYNERWIIKNKERRANDNLQHDPLKTTKQCIGCKVEKPLVKFSLSLLGKFGRRSTCKSCCKEYNDSGPRQISHSNWSKQYYQSNKLKIQARRRESIRNNPNVRIARNLRRRLHLIISENRAGSAVRDCGCSIEFLKNYLEERFLPGMAWSNYGRTGWHIDHISPLSWFDLTNREQTLTACHYTNLQPLWWRDNIVKGDK